MVNTLLGITLFAAAAAAAAVPPVPTQAVAIAERMVTRLYVEPLSIAGAELTTVRERTSDSFSPDKVTTIVKVGSRKLLAVRLDIFEDTVTFLVASGPLFAMAEGADGAQLSRSALGRPTRT
jgi:hypothetical protein